jgi:nitronate monooxygenase
LEEIIPLVAGEKVLKAWETGDVNSAPMMVGQSIGLIHSVPTCAELLDTMIAEAKECLQKTTALMQTP